MLCYLSDRQTETAQTNISGCGAVGSARRLGRRCRRFEPCHSDQKPTENKPFSTYFRFFFIYSAQKQHFFLDHIKPAFLRFEEKKVSIFRISFSLLSATQILRADDCFSSALALYHHLDKLEFYYLFFNSAIAA